MFSQREPIDMVGGYISRTLFFVLLLQFEQ